MKYVSLLLISLTLFSNCNSTKEVNSKNEEIKNQSELKGAYTVTTLYGEDVSSQKITLIFNNENKTISGYSGCNTYSCNYNLQEKAISFTIPNATKRYCMETMEVEKNFFSVLSQSKSKNTKQNVLAFINEAGEEILTAKKGV